MKATGIVRRIDDAVWEVILNGLEKEAHYKTIDEKWKEWNEEN